MEGLPSAFDATYIIMDTEFYSMYFYWDEGRQEFKVVYERDGEMPVWMDRELSMNIIDTNIVYNDWRWIKR